MQATVRSSTSARRALAVLSWLVLIAAVLTACAVDAGPSDPLDQAGPRSRELDAGAPAPVTGAEQAQLAAPRVEDIPPRVEGLTAASTLAQASLTTCTIAFDDYIGLLIIPQQAGHTFATSPWYIEGCGSGWVHVKENDVARYGSSWGSAYNHYHLMYEKGPYCVPSGGSYGYHNGSSCVNVPSPATEPRYVASHHGSEWIRIYVYRSGLPEMTFDFKSIRVRGAQGIKLYFRTAGGAWYHWNNLGPGTWNVAPYAAGIREILIRSSGGSSSSYSFDNVKVGVN